MYEITRDNGRTSIIENRNVTSFQIYYVLIKDNIIFDFYHYYKPECEDVFQKDTEFWHEFMQKLPSNEQLNNCRLAVIRAVDKFVFWNSRYSSSSMGNILRNLTDDVIGSIKVLPFDLINYIVDMVDKAHNTICVSGISRMVCENIYKDIYESNKDSLRKIGLDPSIENPEQIEEFTMFQQVMLEFVYGIKDDIKFSMGRYVFNIIVFSLVVLRSLKNRTNEQTIYDFEINYLIEFSIQLLRNWEEKFERYVHFVRNMYRRIASDGYYVCCKFNSNPEESITNIHNSERMKNMIHTAIHNMRALGYKGNTFIVQSTIENVYVGVTLLNEMNGMERRRHIHQAQQRQLLIQQKQQLMQQIEQQKVQKVHLPSIQILQPMQFIYVQQQMQTEQPVQPEQQNNEDEDEDDYGIMSIKNLINH